MSERWREDVLEYISVICNVFIDTTWHFRAHDTRTGWSGRAFSVTLGDNTTACLAAAVCTVLLQEPTNYKKCHPLVTLTQKHKGVEEAENNQVSLYVGPEANIKGYDKKHCLVNYSANQPFTCTTCLVCEWMHPLLMPAASPLKCWRDEPIYQKQKAW